MFESGSFKYPRMCILVCYLGWLLGDRPAQSLAVFILTCALFLQYPLRFLGGGGGKGGGVGGESYFLNFWAEPGF